MGTWIDGKPIYQKTFTSANVTSGTTEISTDITNIDNMMIISIWLKRDTEVWFLNDKNSEISFYSATNKFSFSLSGTGQTWTLYIIAQYTKTTD